MERRKLSAIFIAFIVMTTSSSPVPAVKDQSIGNLTTNMTIPHNDRFLPILAPILGLAVEELAALLGVGVAAGTAVAVGKTLIEHPITFGGSSGGSYTGSSGGSSGGSNAASETLQTYDGLLSKDAQVIPQIKTQIAPMLVSMTALQLFKSCTQFGPCVGVSPTLFGPRVYMGVLVEKGACPNFSTDEHGKIIALASKAFNNKYNPLTTKAAYQFPFTACNQECCMLKKNLLNGLCFDKGSGREGQCMSGQCSSDKEEITNSAGCDNDEKCCGHHSDVLLG